MFSLAFFRCCHRSHSDRLENLLPPKVPDLQVAHPWTWRHPKTPCWHLLVEEEPFLAEGLLSTGFLNCFLVTCVFFQCFGPTPLPSLRWSSPWLVFHHLPKPWVAPGCCSLHLWLCPQVSPFFLQLLFLAPTGFTLPQVQAKPSDHRVAWDLQVAELQGLHLLLVIQGHQKRSYFCKHPKPLLCPSWGPWS